MDFSKQSIHATILLLTCFALLKKTVVTQSGGKRCPVEQLMNCFEELFPLISNTDTMNCTFYNRFRNCFYFPGCTEQQGASVASRTYLKLIGTHLPKELFLALAASWKNTCTAEQCDHPPPKKDWCHHIMNATDQATDENTMSEMEMIYNRVYKKTLEPYVACHRLQHMLIQWHKFRSARCGPYSPQCYCKEVQLQIELWCNLRCHILFSSRDSSTFRNPSAIAAIIVAVLLVYLLCYCWIF
ncbi:hypothetical protein T02_9185 [Trichinella nativa]|uniref:Uncharacterized protein n=4 Tax=Trichinella TaxID=6333 RepID=A0A0V1L562_9BILA|nr:hypothetical protein T05_5903 [Trichinella murrelli]KRX60956.1 hypothetical protein T09_5640 [Trichinella sp. T9]KRX75743.1 hypothetical protein T06_5542 [Trichinella sp. T6]KRY19739.1 hypothetical protein T12_4775 [Trichinella patagoniensis]KRY55514.1 hypothetical protein T03_9914 [Trichinella britovi]KRZ54593.1 hypothetical protein T02_9185 [Trichinella nativa]KRZ96110.1 hypothetical protein T08_4543 [Trichinella sp. T8]